MLPKRKCHSAKNSKQNQLAEICACETDCNSRMKCGNYSSNKRILILLVSLPHHNIAIILLFRIYCSVYPASLTETIQRLVMKSDKRINQPHRNTNANRMENKQQHLFSTFSRMISGWPEKRTKSTINRASVAGYFEWVLDESAPRLENACLPFFFLCSSVMGKSLLPKSYKISPWCGISMGMAINCVLCTGWRRSIIP